MKEKVKFDLSSMGKTNGEILYLGTALLNSLGSDIVKYKSKEELLYHILKRIFPVNKYIKFSEISIEKACQKVLTRLGIFNKFDSKLLILDEHGNEFKLPYEEQPKSNSDIFCESVLRINFLPYHKYIYLQKMVDKDLKNISDLIQKYENNPLYKKILKNNGKPRNHDERMFRDYYNRCLSERINMLNYKLYDLIPNAVKQSRGSRGLIKNMGFLHNRADVPYYFGKPLNDRYFDIDKIDLISHRIGDFYYPEIHDLIRYYNSNKPKFYRIYFKRKPVKECFIEIQNYLLKLEILKKRIVIFNELENLFRSKKWIGFYALALPQIEGLFSEMCSILFNDGINASLALSDKVEKVRPYYFLEKTYFDYFQYHIPSQRNKFSHTGYDEDFKLKSYDLLADILFLLQTIFELENPAIILLNIIDGKKKNYFSRVSDYVTFFNLKKSISGNKNQKMYNEIISKVKVYEEETLSKTQETERICMEVINNTEDLINNFNTLGIDFNKTDCILNNNEKLNEVKNMFKDNNYYLLRLREYYSFLRGISHLLNIKKEYFCKLAELNKKYRKTLNAIFYIDRKITNYY